MGENFEIIAIEVKVRDPKCTWEFVGNYRAINEDMRGMDIWQPELCVQEILQNYYH